MQRVSDELKTEADPRGLTEVRPPGHSMLVEYASDSPLASRCPTLRLGRGLAAAWSIVSLVVGDGILQSMRMPFNSIYL